MSISRSIKSNQYAEVKKRDRTIRVSTLALGNTDAAHKVPKKHKMASARLHLQGIECSHPGGFKTKKSDLSLKLDCDWSADF